MRKERGRVIEVLQEENQAIPIGVVGSPSDTNQITIDILESAENSRIRGQMVYLVLPHEGQQMAVLGQISRVETKNRWHEDMAFRGIIKRQGELQNLSGRADVRTATISVQAAFMISENDKGEEFSSEDMLGTSPSTGKAVYAVRDEVLSILLEKHQKEIVYLGRVFGTQVKMPQHLRHFGKGAGGVGEAYHIGVFGKTGSGKSGLAAYLLLCYARQREMGVLFIDPQGQFSSGWGLPFDLHRALFAQGRDVKVYKMATGLRLGDNALQFCELLAKAKFYQFLGIKNADNAEIAVEVLYNHVRKALSAAGAKLDAAPGNLLRDTLTLWIADEKSLERIYTGKERREQLAERLRQILTDAEEFTDCQKRWTTALDMFQKIDSKGNERTPLSQVVASMIRTAETDTQPFIFLDISGEGTEFKDDDEIKALLLKEIASTLNREGGEAFAQGKQLNCLVALDEAHRFVRNFTRSSDTTEMSKLTTEFVDAVRTTRKYGLGYLFITQTLASLHREIIGQLRLCAFGYGLTMGSELANLNELVGDPEALSLYRSFVDPQSRKQYPFMFTGPASPLSFTGSPIFVEMFTSYDDFVAANPWADYSSVPKVRNAPLPTRGYKDEESFEKARTLDFD